MAVRGYKDLLGHLGHEVVVVGYSKDGSYEDIDNVAIECLECHEVLIDFDKEPEHEYVEGLITP